MKTEDADLGILPDMLGYFRRPSPVGLASLGVYKVAAVITLLPSDYAKFRRLDVC
jgi:hypothetical protein